jgi:hypothetical protein
MVAVTPDPLCSDVVTGSGNVEVVVREVPDLRCVPDLVTTDSIHGVTYAGKCTLETDTVVARDHSLLKFRLTVAKVICCLVVRISELELIVA